MSFSSFEVGQIHVVFQICFCKKEELHFPNLDLDSIFLLPILRHHSDVEKNRSPISQANFLQVLLVNSKKHFWHGFSEVWRIAFHIFTSFKGVFRTLLNFYDKTFLQKWLTTEPEHLILSTSLKLLQLIKCKACSLTFMEI